MRPEAACKTCCLVGIILEKPKCERKSMPNKGGVTLTAASKKSNAKF
jgi:hypothetical protein